MKKTLISLFILSFLCLPVFSYAQQNQQGIHEPGTGLNDGEQNQAGENQKNEKAVSRRSKVANAVQEMERIATRNKGIGDQVRVIAQNQNQNQEQAEDSLAKAQNRSGFAKFFIGPNYGQLKNTENKLQNCKDDLSELKDLRNQIQDQADKESLDEQIGAMEDVIQEMEDEVSKERNGFALFGWLVKLFT